MCGHFCPPRLTETTLCPYAYVCSSSSSYNGPQLILFGVDVGTVLPWCFGTHIGILRMHAALRFCFIWVLEWPESGWGVFGPYPSVELFPDGGVRLSWVPLRCAFLLAGFWPLSCVWGRSHTRWWLGLCPRQASADPFPSMGLPLAGTHALWPPAWLLPQWGIWPCVPPARGGPLGNVVIQLPSWCVFGWRVKLLSLPSVCNVLLKKVVVVEKMTRQCKRQCTIWDTTHVHCTISGLHWSVLY